MAYTTILPALIERLKEVTKKKHPGVDIMKKPPKEKKPRRRKKKSDGALMLLELWMKALNLRSWHCNSN